MSKAENIRRAAPALLALYRELEEREVGEEVGRRVGAFCVSHGGFKVGRADCDAFIQDSKPHDFYPVVIAEKDADAASSGSNRPGGAS